MKKPFKILVVIISLVAAALLCTSCDNLNLPGEELSGYPMEWYVANNTGIELTLKLSENEWPNIFYVNSFGTYKILRSEHRKKEDANFYIIAEYPRYFPAALYLKNEDTPFQIWKPEDKNEPGKQFYNESSWHVEKDKKNHITIWTFNINEEDLE